ncbi:hypothetical protein BDR26DRAFT_866954 [Obelidium mucronatum]|nr:hypothetical protein BDR26DRAFT_866954 [Obelidium mucronatum]
MYGSNVTFTPMNGASPLSPNGHVPPVGYGSAITADQDPSDVAATSSYHHETLIETNLVASYKWTIDAFSSISDEKIVSPPFGSSDHPWQLVVYPRGSLKSSSEDDAENDQVGRFLSCFLRPLKTLREIEEGEDWFRPVRRFTIRVHKPRQQPERPSYGYSEEDDQQPEESFSYTISPSHPLADEIPEDVLVQDTSVDTEFNGFAASVPGWGFTTLLPLEDQLPLALDPNTGSLTLSACVESLPTVPWTTQTYSWAIPGIQNEIDSQISTLVSPAFGPPNAQWTIHLNPEYSSQTVSAFLQPSLSPAELDSPNWTRSISSFTLKIQSPQSEYGYTHSPSHVSSKTLTGGYTFSAPDNLSTGWPGMLRLDQIAGCVDSHGIFRVDVEVTWISSSAVVTHQAAGTSSVMNAVGLSVTNGISEEEVQERLAKVEAEWETKMQALVLEKQNLSVEIVELEANVSATQAELSKEADKVSDLKVELSTSRDKEQALAEMEERVKVFKARVALLRAGFEDGVETRHGGDDGSDVHDSPAPSKVGLHLIYSDEEKKEDNFFVLKARVLKLEADLATAHELARTQKAQLVDARIFGASDRPMSPTVHRRMSFISECPDGPLAVAEVLENVTQELEAARQSLDEFYNRGAYSHDVAAQVTEKSAALADTSMLYAELSLTRASLFDSCFHHEPHNFPTQNPNSQVSVMIYEIEQLMAEVDHQSAYLKPQAYGQHQYPQQGGYSPYANSNQMAMSPSQYAQSLSINTQQQQQQYQSTESLTKIHELELQIEHFKTQSEMLAAELASKNRLDQLKAQGIFEANSPGFPASVMSSPGGARGIMKFGSTGAVHARGRGDMYPEPWTPVGKDGGPVSAAELSKMLASLQQSSSTRNFVSATLFLVTLLATTFVSYATLHVHCHPSSTQANSLLCQTTVPIYNSLSVAWHTAAQKFVSDVVPYTSNTLSSATQSTLHVLDQVDKKVKKDWERAERERVAKIAMEKEKWELEKQAKEAQLKLDLLEQKKMEELRLREKNLIEKWESERKAKDEKVEAERKAKEEAARKQLDEWIENEKRKAAEKMKLDVVRAPLNQDLPEVVRKEEEANTVVAESSIPVVSVTASSVSKTTTSSSSTSSSISSNTAAASTSVSSSASTVIAVPTNSIEGSDKPSAPIPTASSDIPIPVTSASAAAPVQTSKIAVPAPPPKRAGPPPIVPPPPVVPPRVSVASSIISSAPVSSSSTVSSVAEPTPEVIVEPATDIKVEELQEELPTPVVDVPAVNKEVENAVPVPAPSVEVVESNEHIAASKDAVSSDEPTIVVTSKETIAITSVITAEPIIVQATSPVAVPTPTPTVTEVVVKPEGPVIEANAEVILENDAIAEIPPEEVESSSPSEKEPIPGENDA